jgi:hypothetical protein
MPPPPPESSRALRVQGSGGFKPAGSGRNLHAPNPQSNDLSGRAPSQRSDQNQPISSNRIHMGPPPTPQARAQAPNRSAFNPISTQAQPQASHPIRIQTASVTPVADLPPIKSSARFTGPSSTNRFMPPPANTNPNPGNQHFFPPPTPTNGSRFVPAGSRAPSRAMNASSGQGGQRMPFVPGTQNGFG